MHIGSSIWTPILCLFTIASAGFVEQTYQGEQSGGDSTLDTAGHDVWPLGVLSPNATIDSSTEQDWAKNANAGIGPQWQEFATATVDILAASLTGLLPVTPHSLEHLRDILETLLDTDIGDIVLVASPLLAPLVTKRVKETFESLPARSGQQSRFRVQQREFDVRTAEYVALAATALATPWLLVMDQDGLKGLDSRARTLLLHTGHVSLPLGPRGEGPILTESSGYPAHLNLMSYLKPPFVIPRTLLPRDEDAFRTWDAFGEYLARCNVFKAGGVVLDPTYLPSTQSSEGIPVATSTEEKKGSPTRFTFLLSDPLHVHRASPFACQLLSNGHHLNILVVETTMKYSFNPVRRKTRVTSPLCKLEFFTVNQFMHRRELVNHLGDIDTDVVIGLKEHVLNQHFMDHFVSRGSVHVLLEVEDLSACDWMASISLIEWQHWHTFRIDISVITRDRPQSLRRLLKSLTEARYYGDTVNLRLNLEQDCDYETLRIAHEFNRDWVRGAVFLHRRTIHAGLLPAIVESWYPADNNSYGLLLEDDVEVSPLFFAWVKKAILKYRYGREVHNSDKLFGISLYQQKHVELRQEGRVPFNARTLFAAQADRHPHSSTPYLSQVPCSWGAVYFPEHWREFHEYLALRFTEKWLSIEETVAPNVRSNNWTKSWKKFFIELVFLRGYFMLYPNFDGFLSLSTNHLELGAHVKVRSKEKQELFDLPLMPLPPANELSALSDDGNTLANGGAGRLPRFRDLPTLDLTASLTTLEEAARIGLARQTTLCNTKRATASMRSSSGSGSSNHHNSFHNFICAGP